MPLCKRILAVFIPLIIVIFYRNENTSAGDKWRHRPLWLAPVNYLAPDWELKPEWFLRGTEDEVTREGLVVTVRSLNKDAQITKVGKIISGMFLWEQLQQRECVELEVAKKVKNDEASIPPPIVVLGLPRTGTTFMHGMLGESTIKHRVPRFHEYMRSCPKRGGIFHQVRQELQGLKMFAIRKLTPTMKAMHYIKSTSPEEDIMALGHDMINMMLFTGFYVPTYTEWLKNDTEKKLDHSLKYLRKFLDQHLREPSDKRPWILKTPWHLVEILEFEKVFPGTKYIWMHRDPIETFSSLVDLSVRMTGMGSDITASEKNRNLIAKYTVDMWFWILKRGVDARNRSKGKIKFIDVKFETLNDDPVEVAEKVFKELGFSVDEALHQKFIKFAKENGRTKRGKHIHELTHGLNATEVELRYNEIMSKLIETNYIQ